MHDREQDCVRCGDHFTSLYDGIGWLCDGCVEVAQGKGELCAFGPAGEHDEAFACVVCDRLVCGVCATPGEDDGWFCPDCVTEVADAA